VKNRIRAANILRKLRGKLYDCSEKKKKKKNRSNKTIKEFERNKYYIVYRSHSFWNINVLMFNILKLNTLYRVQKRKKTATGKTYSNAFAIVRFTNVRRQVNNLLKQKTVELFLRCMVSHASWHSTRTVLYYEVCHKIYVASI